LTRHLAGLYQTAKEALDMRDYGFAKDLLQQILVVDQDYKDAAQLLSQVVKKKLEWLMFQLCSTFS